ncbi:hypothetical protein AB4099_29600 [Bosea sp. 2KB_26]|uniref:hypothetical protein n=1 Tax=Bosea sp. 2KB_26 TaxID=3237475 RepID=UPI003F91AFB8
MRVDKPGEAGDRAGGELCLIERGGIDQVGPRWAVPAADLMKIAQEIFDSVDVKDEWARVAGLFHLLAFRPTENCGSRCRDH